MVYSQIVNLYLLHGRTGPIVCVLEIAMTPLGFIPTNRRLVVVCYDVDHTTSGCYGLGCYTPMGRSIVLEDIEYPYAGLVRSSSSPWVGLGLSHSR